MQLCNVQYCIVKILSFKFYFKKLQTTRFLASWFQKRIGYLGLTTKPRGQNRVLRSRVFNQELNFMSTGVCMHYIHINTFQLLKRPV
jgi:hypothetical protein